MRLLIIHIISLTLVCGLFTELPTSSRLMVEICDNGIDDDLDGLVDINDDDCMCDPIVPSGLIPNPSFEDLSCCPQVKARLDCADSWIQASAATSDYVHTCGFLGNVIDVPLPIADGDGAIGLRDGSTDDGNYKEYAGACLSEPIEAGKSYLLRMNVGFTTQTTSPAFKLSIFGHPTCANLPFGNNNPSIGCPTNSAGWILLGEVNVSGSNEWVETEIDFQTNQDINAVVIGPDCGIRNQVTDRYYFLDNLRLAETIDFGYQVEINAGNPCLANYTLGLSATAPDESYQWFRNGIAIVGATSSTYDVPDDGTRSADYQVRIEDATGCQLTDAYEVSIPSNTRNQMNIECANTVYAFGDQMLTTDGTYTTTFIDQNGCDSTVTLDLTFRPEVSIDMDTIICTNSSIEIGGQEINAAGDYTITLVDRFGCDSTIYLAVREQLPAAYIDLMDAEITLGRAYNFDLQGQDDMIRSFSWRSSTGLICSDCSTQSVFPIEETTYYLDGVDVSGCIIRDSFTLSIDKDYSIFVPNVFTPNGDGINDIFTIYPNEGLGNVQTFRIFDRWGNLVYEAINTLNLIWDGKHRGKILNADTYIYVAELAFVDGHIETVSGSVNLLR